MNAHSCWRASVDVSANRAVPMLRAGFTEVLSTGMEMRWMRVKVRPATTPPMPGANLRVVVKRTTMTRIPVSTTSATIVAPRPK